VVCIRELLSSGTTLLASENVPSPGLDAALLLAEASGLSREQLYTRSDCEVDEARRNRYFELLERRRRGECTAYILGRKEFWGLEFTVTPAVLVPRPETEILVEAALAILRSMPAMPNASALDLCTGSGAVAIALKHECPSLEVTAADISEEALEVARSNAQRLGCAVTFLRGDLFEALNRVHPQTGHDGARFCLITDNAPYVPPADMAGLPAEVRNEPRLALDGGPGGLALIRRIIAEAPLYLEAGGSPAYGCSLVLEGDPSQMETMAALMKNRGFGQLRQYRDLAGNNRVISGSLQ
jgi:release factor glutamine methyltransferase